MSTTETTATERITAEDLVLLAGVMGWKRKPKGVRIEDCDADTYMVSPAGWAWTRAGGWSPGTDLQQAFDLLAAWKAGHRRRRWRIDSPEDIKGYKSDNFWVWLFGGAPMTEAPTLPMAICLAVLAAIRADDKPRIREFLNIPQPTRDGILKGLGIKVGVAPVDYTAAMVEIREAGKMGEFAETVGREGKRD